MDTQRFRRATALWGMAAAMILALCAPFGLAAAESGAQTYTNPAYGVSFAIPKGWTICVTKDEPAWFQAELYSLDNAFAVVVEFRDLYKEALIKTPKDAENEKAFRARECTAEYFAEINDLRIYEFKEARYSGAPFFEANQYVTIDTELYLTRHSYRIKNGIQVCVGRYVNGQGTTQTTPDIKTILGSIEFFSPDGAEVYDTQFQKKTHIEETYVLDVFLIIAWGNIAYLVLPFIWIGLCLKRAVNVSRMTIFAMLLFNDAVMFLLSTFLLSYIEYFLLINVVIVLACFLVMFRSFAERFVPEESPV